jgi:hypothetical protein
VAKLAGIYFLPLPSIIYFSVMTHLRQGKKVSIFPLGDVCHVYCAFCRYANHIYVSHAARTNYGDECDSATDYTYAIYNWRAFSLGEECIGPSCCMASYIHIASRCEP